ncbi:hypothetical protein SANTM175S_08581 [Streptomyces antimycoticus]
MTRLRTTGTAACAVLLAVVALTGCNRESNGAGGGKVGIDMPRTDTDFWRTPGMCSPPRSPASPRRSLGGRDDRGRRRGARRRLPGGRPRPRRP